MNTPLKSTALAAAAAALLGAVGTAQAADYANVVSATPVTRSFAVPRQQCGEGQRVVPSQPSGGGALVGAIIGGVVGNQFGHGAGRVAATTLGAVAGGAIGNQAELHNSPGQLVPVRECRTVSSHETRVVGYDVVYEYHGQRYSTHTATDPGPRLAIDVRPAGAAPLDYAQPRGGYAAVPPARSGYDEAGYGDVAPVGYYRPAPPAYYPPAPVYYDAPVNYVAPAVIGLGLGYWIGNRWNGGHRGHYHRGGRYRGR